MASAGGRDVARASAWRVLRTSSETVLPAGDRPPALPGDASRAGRPAAGWTVTCPRSSGGRCTASFAEPGPATVWTRLRYPLVPDEEPGPLERVLAVADSGNGLSGALDIAKWLFINPELTVHLHREAAGEWICLAAQTAISAGGAGLATSACPTWTGRSAWAPRRC